MRSAFMAMALIFCFGLLNAAEAAPKEWMGKLLIREMPVYVSGENPGYITPVISEELTNGGVRVVDSQNEAEAILLVRMEYRFQNWQVDFTLTDLGGVILARSSGINSDFNTAIRIALNNLIK